ncbi:MAG: Fe-S cluster assembly protein SufD [Micavibrio sp.]|nr:Fe-S cluster assembly protein SufD [Micavibrio sp.]
MTAAAGKETFMAAAPQNAAALPWLEGATALEKDNAPAWVKALRASGAEAFAATGLPIPQTEGWQYTNLRPLQSAGFKYSAEPVKFDAARLPAPLLADSYRVVLVNGQFQQKLSTLPPQATVLSLLDAAETLPKAEEYLVRLGDLAEHPLVALNTAYVRDGVVLSVPKGGEVDKPVEVLFYTLGDKAAVYPRVLYYLGENSGMTVLERHAGEGAYFANSYLAAVQEQASRLKIYRFNEESTEGYHYSQLALQQHKSSSFEGFSHATGGKLAREEFRMQLIDQGISSSIGGTYLMNGQQSHDFTILADHFEPDGTSIQHFKGVLDDQARAVFQGKIHVRRNAQKTDGYQSHHAILLSDRAEASAKPELEIYADDVKCSHGATAGQMDADALFYLRSRGIPEALAKSLIIESFLNEAIDKVTFEPVRDLYRARISAWLAGRTA